METSLSPIRKAKLSDIDRLTEIYNQAINAGYCTCDIKLFTTQERVNWFESHKNERYPIFVYEIDEEPVGYAYLSPYREGRDALNEVGEISYYVDFNYHGFGIAKKLINHTLQAAKELGYSSIIAILLEHNRESVSLLKRFSFTEWGVLPKVARLKDKYYSHLYYGLKL